MATNTETLEPTNTIPSAKDGLQYRLAYEETAPDRAALREDDLQSVNAEVPVAVHIALGAVRHITDLRPKMTTLPVDLPLIDKVETYAHASGYAHALYTVASEPPAELEPLYEACLVSRATLRSDVNNLALHSIVNADALHGLSGEVGHRNVGYDLLSLVTIYRASKTAIAGRSAILPEAIDRAEQMASSLLDLVAKRETQLKDQADVVNQRRRAFTLLVNAYDEAQQAVSFLRWKHSDAEKFVPSLFSARGAGRPKSAKAAANGASNAAASHGDNAAPATAGTTPNAAAPATTGNGTNPPGTNNGSRGGNPFG